MSNDKICSLSEAERFAKRKLNFIILQIRQQFGHIKDMDEILDMLLKEINNMPLIISYETKITVVLAVIDKVIAELNLSNTLEYIQFKNNIKRLYRPLPIGQSIFYNSLIGLGISAICITAFTLVSLYTAPLWLSIIATGLFAGAVTYLSGLLYGFINDLFAVNMNLPYFLLGHNPNQFTVFKSNKPLVQATTWGFLATFGLTIPAAIIFTIAISITAIFVPIATFILPALIILMPIVTLAAEWFAQRSKKALLNNLPITDWNESGLNESQVEALEIMAPTREAKASWYANSSRNLFGYACVPLIGVASLATIITISALNSALPAILFSSALFATFMPVGFAAVVLIALVTVGIYTHYNKNKIIDNEYKLFDVDENIDSLNADPVATNDETGEKTLLPGRTFLGNPWASSKENTPIDNDNFERDAILHFS